MSENSSMVIYQRGHAYQAHHEHGLGILDDQPIAGGVGGAIEPRALAAWIQCFGVRRRLSGIRKQRSL